MHFTVALVMGLLLGSGLLALSGRRTSRSGVRTHPAWTRWTALALGAAAAATFAAGMAGATDTVFAILPAVALPAAGVVFAAGRLAFGDRRWQSWLGLVLSCVPALFWIVFIVGELVGPAH